MFDASNSCTSVSFANLPSLEQFIEHSPNIVAPNTSLSEVIRLMSQIKSYVLVVVERQLLGIFTEQDVVKLTAYKSNLSQLTVAEVMTREVITLTKSNSENAFTALALLQKYQIRHLPVLNQHGQLVGVITQDTICQVLPPANLFKRRHVASVMTTQLVYAQKYANVLSLAQLMIDHNVGCVVITETRSESHLNPIGIISKEDIVQFQALELDLEKIQAETVISHPLFCLSPEDSLLVAHQEMQKRGVRQLVVVGKFGELLAIVTQTNLLQSLDVLEIVLELRVQERTAELEKANLLLQQEIQQRQQVEVALRESKAKLDDILNSAFVAIVRFRIFANLDWEYDYFSKGCESIFGYTSEELMVNKFFWLSRVFPEDRENLILPLFEDFFAERCVELDFRFYHKNGSLIWISVAYTSQRDEEADCWIVTAVDRDITEHKLAEEALRESETQYSSVIAAMREGIILQDASGRITACNPAAESILGLTNKQIIGRTSCDPGWGAIHEDGSPFKSENHPAMVTLRTGEPTSNTVMGIRKPNGALSWILINSQPLLKPGEKTPYAVVTSFSDITRRKEAEVALLRSNERLTLTLEAAKMGSWDWNVLANETIWSPQHEIIFGYEPGIPKRTYKDWSYRVHPEDLPAAEAYLQAVMSNQQQYQWEYRIILPNGDIRWVTAFGRFYYDTSGQPIRMLGVVRDITDKKQLEAQLYRVQRLESLGTLASGIAHDLNNILTPILAIAQLLPIRLKNLDARSLELLNMQQINAKRGADLVKQILSFARGADDKRSVVDIKQLLLDIEQIAKGTFPKSIEIQKHLPDYLATVTADGNQLHQILMNLLVNACDAMPDGGSITISANNLFIDENYAKMNIEAKVGAYVVITVTDTGVGISPNIINRIFDPFFTTKDIGKGTGLGLHTVIGIVKNHGGFVNVHSEVNKGSRFQVYLPASDGALSQTFQDQQILTGGGELIFLVDDEAVIIETTKSTLETYNYRVLAASDSFDAIATYVQRKGDINVVLMDMMMPLIDGENTIRILQKINPHVQIIAMSGLTSTEMFAKAARVGVKQFLSKPFTAQELLHLLHRLLNEK